MPHPAFNVVGIPQNKWAIPRSYYQGIAIRTDPATVNWSGYVMQLTDAAHTVVYWTWEFYPHVIDWNSNRYTLDHIVSASYYTAPPSPTEYGLDVVVQPIQRPGYSLCYLQVSPYFGGSQVAFHDIAAAPSTYWLPPPHI